MPTLSWNNETGFQHSWKSWAEELSHQSIFSLSTSTCAINNDQLTISISGTSLLLTSPQLTSQARCIPTHVALSPLRPRTPSINVNRHARSRKTNFKTFLPTPRQLRPRRCLQSFLKTIPRAEDLKLSSRRIQSTVNTRPRHHTTTKYQHRQLFPSSQLDISPFAKVLTASCSLRKALSPSTSQFRQAFSSRHWNRNWHKSSSTIIYDQDQLAA